MKFRDVRWHVHVNKDYERLVPGILAQRILNKPANISANGHRLREGSPLVQCSGASATLGLHSDHLTSCLILSRELWPAPRRIFVPCDSESTAHKGRGSRDLVPGALELNGMAQSPRKPF